MPVFAIYAKIGTIIISPSHSLNHQLNKCSKMVFNTNINIIAANVVIVTVLIIIYISDNKIPYTAPSTYITIYSMSAYWLSLMNI